MIRYWLPVRVLFYDVPHHITGRGVILVMRSAQNRRHLPGWAVVLILLALVAIAAEVRGALGAR